MSEKKEFDFTDVLCHENLCGGSIEDAREAAHAGNLADADLHLELACIYADMLIRDIGNVRGDLLLERAKQAKIDRERSDG